MAFDGYQRFADQNHVHHERTHTDIERAAAQAEIHLAANKTHEQFSKETKGVIGRSALLDLPYFDVATMTITDAMHVIPGVIGRHLFRMLSGKALKAKAAKARSKHKANVADEDEKALKEVEARYAKYQADMKKYNDDVTRIRETMRAGTKKHAEAVKKLKKPDEAESLPLYRPSAASAAAAAAGPALVEVSYSRSSTISWSLQIARCLQLVLMAIVSPWRSSLSSVRSWKSSSIVGTSLLHARRRSRRTAGRTSWRRPASHLHRTSPSRC